MKAILLALCLLVPATTQAAESARVMVLGTYHFWNPGQDLNNVESVDVTTPQRQAELQQVTDALARFQPTLVAVEWPAIGADERYTKYRDGSLPPSSNEVVQIGFRLARQRGLERVHGIDVDGDFPFEAVHAWAAANGKTEALGALMQGAAEETARITDLQARLSIGGVLRDMNRPAAVADGHGLYSALLRFGKGDEQPGVAVNAAWGERNLAICARLLQALKPGDRAVVVYGQGHAYLLRRCVMETPGVELVEANDYLPDEVGASR